MIRSLITPLSTFPIKLFTNFSCFKRWWVRFDRGFISGAFITYVKRDLGSDGPECPSK